MMARDPWEWGLYRIVTEDGPKRRAGWFWRSWAVNSRPRRGPFILTHLPTGRRVVEFPSARAARRFAELVDPLADWQTVTAEMALKLLDARLAQIEHAYTAALRSAGFTVRPRLRGIAGGRA